MVRVTDNCRPTPTLIRTVCPDTQTSSIRPDARNSNGFDRAKTTDCQLGKMRFESLGVVGFGGSTVG